MIKVIQKIKIFLEMIKFEHSIFALPFAYMGLFLAEKGWPSLDLFLWVTLAMVSFRSMAMGANRLLDASIDAQNPRTSQRAIPAGKIKRSHVWVITIAFLVIFEWTCLNLNALCFKLSPSIVFFAWLYPFLKRMTWLCHFVLGFILGIAPYGAWLASLGSFSWVPAWFMIGITCWVAGFDVIYALQDCEFDQAKGLHSFPAKFGKQKSLLMTALLHIIALICWFLAGYVGDLGIIYNLGLLGVGIFLIREHWLVHRFGLEKIQEAFFIMNAWVSISVFVCVLIDIFF